MDITDQTQTNFVQQEDKKAFEKIFNTHYQSLHGYAFTILGDDAAADESVQEVFFKLWVNRKRLTITRSLKGYLYTSIYNQCMTHIRQRQQKKNYQSHVQSTTSGHSTNDCADQKIKLDELQQKLRQALNSLPEGCRTVFYLSRFEQMSYRDIAAQLGLSIKTIEAQISKALKLVRVSLAEFI